MDIYNLIDSLNVLFTANNRVYWLYILSSIFIASIYLMIYKKEKKVNLSKKLWLHPSGVLDYKYFFISLFIKTLLIFPFLIAASDIAMFTYEYLLLQYGSIQVTLLSKTNVMILYTVVLFVVSDFTSYWIHRFLHTIPFLWEFHKVHHSAKVLNPLTFYRIHPLENVLFSLRYALSIGFTSGVFIYFFGSLIGIVEIIGVNLILFIFLLMGSNLRHSHIKIKYPKLLENFFISPYQHQIHHSTKFYNKNYGAYLAIWDKLFGSIAYSSCVRRMKLGVHRDEFQSINSLLFKPFVLLVRRYSIKKSKKN